MLTSKMRWIGGLLIAGLLATSRGQYQPTTQANVDVKEGENAVLKCRFDPSLARNNQVSLYWSHKTARNWDNVAIQQDVFRERYRVDYEATEGKYDLLINSATYDKDNGEFECKVRRVGSGNDLHAEHVTLTVLMPPDPPVISSDLQTLNEGEPVILTCSSTGGSPPPEIRWYRRGSSTPLEADLTPAEVRSQPTVSRLRLEPTKDDDGAQLECVTWNRAMEEGQRMTTSTQLTVNYFPRITLGPENPLRVEVGGSVRMECDVDAKPSVANVRWIRNNNFINTNRVHRIDSVQLADAGMYTCSAQNEVGEQKADLRLEVLYGPLVRVPPEQEVPAGSSVQVRCEVDSSPPPDSVGWLKSGDPQFYQQGNTLQLSRVTAEDSGEYICVAGNQVQSQGMAQPEERLGNATTSVLIRHAPGRAYILPEEPVGVQGRPLTLTCRADPPGHPTPRYRWWRGDQPDVPLAFAANLSLSSVERQHAGQYLCQPENELGSGSVASVDLQVYRAPELGAVLQPDVVRETTSVDFTVSCAARGRPRPVISWLKDQQQLLPASDSLYQAEQSEQNELDDVVLVRSTLRFSGPGREQGRLTPADRGNYTCLFENLAGTADSTMLLRIKHAPVVYHRYNKVAFDVEETAEIRCEMQAFPEPDFSWTFNGLPLAADPTGFYSINSTSLGNDVFASVLTLKQVRQSDYGEYVCQARNEEGEHSTVLRLQPKGRPEAPTDLQVLDVGTSWALLDWTPGFDGGYPSTFYHATLVDERNRDRPIDCQTERPCNITQLQHRTTYRLRLRATNLGGDSEFSEQTQFSTLLDVSRLPLPQQVQFERGSQQLRFHVVSSPVPVVGAVEIRSGSDDEEWRSSGQYVPVANNRGSEALGLTIPADQVRVRLCLRDNREVCGDPVTAELVPAGSLVAPSGMAVSTIIIIVVVVIVAAIVLAVILVCCCRRQSKSSKKVKKATTADTNRQKLPAYYPPGAGLESKSASDAPDLSVLNQDTNKALYGGRPGYDYPGHHVGPDHPPASNAAINLGYMDNSYSNSNNGGSVNSQDSLWQVKAGLGAGGAASGQTDNHSYGSPEPRGYPPHPDPRQYPYDPHGYDPGQAEAGYGDYAHYPPRQDLYPGEQTYPQHDAYGRPYEAEPYGAARGRPYSAGDGGGYRDISGLPDPYAPDQEADKPPQMSFDESLESGYSTPNSRNRRVIREIIV